MVVIDILKRRFWVFIPAVLLLPLIMLALLFGNEGEFAEEAPGWLIGITILTPVAALVGILLIPALRLAKPASWWAGRFYDDEKLARAADRFGTALPAKTEQLIRANGSSDSDSVPGPDSTRDDAADTGVPSTRTRARAGWVFDLLVGIPAGFFLALLILSYLDTYEPFPTIIDGVIGATVLGGAVIGVPMLLRRARARRRRGRTWGRVDEQVEDSAQMRAAERPARGWAHDLVVGGADGAVVAGFLGIPLVGSDASDWLYAGVVLAGAVAGVVLLRRERSRWLAGGLRRRGWIILARVLAGLAGSFVLLFLLMLLVLWLVYMLACGPNLEQC